MTEIFGGLWLENLVSQDKRYELMSILLDREAISGVQLRVAHPVYTPGLSENLHQITSSWPGGLFIHIGAENVGVDLGEQFDETGEFTTKSGDRDWRTWNKETFDWGLRVASALEAIGLCAHSGYGSNSDDKVSQNKSVDHLRSYQGKNIALENVPPLVDRDHYIGYQDGFNWSRDTYWGFGGTPQNMRALLTQLGEGWKCLIDWTHLIVTANQAAYFESADLNGCQDIEQLVAAYLALSHSEVCHYSGCPPEEIIMDSHDYIDNRPKEPILDALKHEAQIICLETSLDDIDESLKQIGILLHFLQ